MGVSSPMEPVASCPISARGAIISFSSSKETVKDFLNKSNSFPVKFNDSSFLAS